MEGICKIDKFDPATARLQSIILKIKKLFKTKVKSKNFQCSICVNKILVMHFTSKKFKISKMKFMTRIA